MVAVLLGALAFAPRVAGADEPRLGMMVDAGVPSGMTGAVAYRPSPRLRLHAGVSHNLVGLGFRGGVVLRGTTGVVAPTLSLEVGRFDRADASWLVSRLDVSADTGALSEVGYDYGGGHAGLEIGGDAAIFFFQVGATAIKSALFFDDVSQQDGVQREVRTRTELDFWTLSGRAGVLVWF